MTQVVLDDSLLRDLLARRPNRQLEELVGDVDPVTTNLFYLRLCRSVISAGGGQLTGSWSQAQRQALGRTLSDLPSLVTITPMRSLGYRMAELADAHRLSSLGAEAVAAAEHLHAPLIVWEGNDGPGIRSAAEAIGVEYRAIARRAHPS